MMNNKNIIISCEDSNVDDIVLLLIAQTTGFEDAYIDTKNTQAGEKTGVCINLENTIDLLKITSQLNSKDKDKMKLNIILEDQQFEFEAMKQEGGK